MTLVAPLLEKRVCGVAKRSARIDDVVDQQAILAFYIADDVHDFGFARALPALVDDRQLRVQSLGESARAHDAADVWRHHHDVGELLVFRLHVARHDRHREQIVGGDIEETLDLAGMEVKRQHAVDAGAGDHVGDQFRRNRRTAGSAAILPRIAEIGDYRRDAPRRGAHERIDHDQQFHQMVVGRKRRRLQDEDILAAHILLDLDEDFLVGEAADTGLSKRDVEIASDALGQHPIGIAREKFHAVFLANAQTRI